MFAGAGWECNKIEGDKCSSPQGGGWGKVSGENDSVRSALRGAVASSDDGGAAIWLVEFGADGVIAWEVQRDACGTPRARHWPAIPADTGDDAQALFQEHLRPLIGDRPLLLLVLSSADATANEILDVLADNHPEAIVCHCTSPLADIMREVISETPLTHWYELIGLRRMDSGRLVFDSFPLFPREAVHGYRQPLRIQCEPSEDGTVFAVVAQLRGKYRLVSVQSAMLAPGVYEPTAVLVRPGRVVFEGLPVKSRAEHSSWPALVTAVPPTLDRTPPAHLICAIELTGTAEQLDQRIERIDKLVEHASLAGGELSVSLVSYGAHSFHRKVPDESVTVLARAGRARAAQAALARVRERRPPDGEYPKAAQLECALAEIYRLIDRRDGRPVLVTAGSRPAFPPRADLLTQILPCPHRTDWHSELKRLTRIPDITFGAICDASATGPIWTELGREARESPDIIDVRPFAERLQLTRPTMYVPFPLIDGD
jgi:hypothetical protein